MSSKRCRKPLFYPLSYGGSTWERRAAVARLGSGVAAPSVEEARRNCGANRKRCRVGNGPRSPGLQARYRTPECEIGKKGRLICDAIAAAT